MAGADRWGNVVLGPARARRPRTGDPPAGNDWLGFLDVARVVASRAGAWHSGPRPSDQEDGDGCHPPCGRRARTARIPWRRVYAYLDWLDGRAPDEIPIRLLVDDITGEAPSYWRSLALPLGISSVVGILGVLLRSRGVLALAFIGGLGTFVWWILREADLRDELDISDFEAGAWVLVGSAAALLIGGAALRRFSTPGALRTPMGPDSPVRPLDTGA